MTVYLRNIEELDVKKVIKKIRTYLKTNIGEENIIELYFIGRLPKKPTVIDDNINTLYTLTNYLLLIKNNVNITMTFRGYNSNLTSLLYLLPFKKYISPEVLYGTDSIQLDCDIKSNYYSLLERYKLLVNFDRSVVCDIAGSNGCVYIKDLPNVTIIKN